MNYLSYSQFFKEYVKPYLKENDKPYNRQLFNDSLDMALKEKTVHYSADVWVYPKDSRFE